MNVQLMNLDVNSLQASQKLVGPKNSVRNRESFSSVLEKSKIKQQAPSNQKVSNRKEDFTKKPNEKVVTDSQALTSKEAEQTHDTKTDEISTEEREAKLMKDMAQLLDITVDELETILAALQIGFADLLQGDNLQKLIMQVHGVDEPMDLLLIPEISSIIEEVSSVVTEYMTNTTGQEVEPDNVVLEKTGLTINRENQSLALVNQKDELETNDVNQNNETKVGLKQDDDSTVNINLSKTVEESLSQNEEESGFNENNTGNQFLDHLTQSMGESLKTSSIQVNDTFDTVMPKGEVVNPRVVLEQIVDKIKVSSIENEAIMNIQLKPEHLGKLSMEVVSNQGIMTAKITVENEKTKLMLEQNIESLKENLEDKGLVIQELEVAIGHNQSESSQTHEGPRPNRNISEIISSMMEEEVTEGEVRQESVLESSNEVDFIA